MWTVVCSVVLLSVMCVCAAEDVLVVFPETSTGRSKLGESICKIMLDAGHRVTYISPSLEQELPGLTWIDVSSIYERTGRAVLEHVDVQRLLADIDITFQVVIVEWTFTGLLAPLGAVFDCPVIWYGATEAHSPMSLMSGSQAAQDSTLAERAHRLWMQVYHLYELYAIERPAYYELYSPALARRGVFRPEYEQLVYNGSLMLINSHPPLSSPHDLPQNVKYVGGHHIEHPPRPLPEDLEQLIGEAKPGVIYFSLGSGVRSEHFSDKVKKKLVQMFSELEQTVVWELDEKLPNLAGHLYMLDRAPRASILNHPNLALFISGGDIISLIESTQFGVPIVGVVLSDDQVTDVDRAVGRGCGLRVDFDGFDDDFVNDLKLAIRRILDDLIGYRIRARRAQLTFRYRLGPARWELAHWVQHVLETRGARHLRSPALLVPWYQKVHLDLFVMLLTALWILHSLLKCLLTLRKNYSGNKEKKEH